MAADKGLKWSTEQLWGGGVRSRLILAGDVGREGLTDIRRQGDPCDSTGPVLVWDRRCQRDVVRSGKDAYEVEHIWANHYERFEAFFPQRSEFDSTRN
ncbi:hypothetical protein OCH239_10735 [Roseivivax halodurans JCM 10272]|uniref:Uncharacterized protein n=1 Tax=Roseivivax halodurans JCM 10272 TaxID=1449350 RepID=X7EE70_9RHOB|nr:hypothetical protein OCH239_10735 [Roseivivax halodurans JCM 10272]